MGQLIDRINELYHKSQKEGLTIEEKEEQKKLREEYVKIVRENFKKQLNNIDIENEDGSITNLGEKYRAKNNETLH